MKVDELLSGVASVIDDVRFCWLITCGLSDRLSARPMGLLSIGKPNSQWTISFVTDRHSRKAAQLRRGARAAVIFQHEIHEAYIRATGPAVLCEGASEISERWKPEYDAYFPTEEGRGGAAFIDLQVEELELWIRGLTPEPFGRSSTHLHWLSGSGWQIGVGREVEP